MKKKDQKLLLIAAAAGGAFYFWQKKKKETPSVSGYGAVPGIGATLPDYSIVPASMRGKCSPWWMDAGVWGLAGAALGYYGLAKKKF